MKLHPQIIEKQGKKEFVVLPFEEFENLLEIAEAYEELVELRQAKLQTHQEPGIPLDKVVSELAPELKR